MAGRSVLRGPSILRGTKSGACIAVLHIKFGDKKKSRDKNVAAAAAAVVVVATGFMPYRFTHTFWGIGRVGAHCLAKLFTAEARLIIPER